MAQLPGPPHNQHRHQHQRHHRQLHLQQQRPLQHNQLERQQQPRPHLRPHRSANKPLPDIIVGGKYRLLSRIGNGSFGELYRAAGIKHGEEVAVKLESASVRHPQLPREAKIYNILRGGIGFPHIRHFGTEGIYNVLVIDLLGPTLEDLLNFCARNFSMKTTLMLADQILARVEYVHMNCLLHRDIKPENFLMGLGRQRTCVFMIDFGLAKKFFSPRTQQHIAYNEQHDLVGTARYASVRAHYAEQGRRDDLESVGYLLLYFISGNLPWQGIKAATRQQKYEKIAETKSAMSLNALCAGIPFEFYMYLKYCRSLHFAEQPDYMYLRQLFKVLFRNQNMLYDYIYDWVALEMQKRQQQPKQAQDKEPSCERLRLRHRLETPRGVCLCSYHQHQQRQQRQRERELRHFHYAARDRERDRERGERRQ